MERKGGLATTLPRIEWVEVLHSLRVGKARWWRCPTNLADTYNLLHNSKTSDAILSIYGSVTVNFELRDAIMMCDS